MSSEARKPWDKRENEPSLWWDRFNRFYRPQGPGRTLTQAYRSAYEEKNGASPTRAGYSAAWKEKATLWNWQGRAEAWDEELHREQTAYEKAEALEMTGRQIKDAKAVQTLAMNEILKRGFAKESTVAVFRALAKAQELERTAREIPDNLAKIGEMDDDELKRAIAKELIRGGLSEADRELGHDSDSDGGTVRETDGSEQASGDSDDRPNGVPGPDAVSAGPSGVRDKRTESEAEKLADQGPQETSDN
ncbi:MAG: hypothetical protein KAJ19_27360 [Gammaproteobacteria bacterium]|nr:hypothetical protein [Gammaproteobacteria bacterium]